VFQRPWGWEELAQLKDNGDVGSLRFSPEDVVKRAQSQGDLFAPLLEMKQSLPKSFSEGGGPTKPLAKQASVTSPRPTIPKRDDAKLASLPKATAAFISPMLLLRTERLPEGSGWLYELKLDCYRAIAAKSAGCVRVWSRNENDFGVRYPAIAKALTKLPDDTVVDGEIVALDEERRPSFKTLQNYGSAQTPVIYYLFDVMVLNGRDLRGKTPLERRQLLEEHVFPELAEPIRSSPVLPGSLNDLIAAVEGQGLEGLVGKGSDSRYESGERSGAWMKMRINQGQEFVIGGYSGRPRIRRVSSGITKGRISFTSREPATASRRRCVASSKRSSGDLKSRTVHSPTYPRREAAVGGRG
jgi:ATP-dependent DNA ligase